MPFSSPGISLTQGSNPGLLRCRQILFFLFQADSLLSEPAGKCTKDP